MCAVSGTHNAELAGNLLRVRVRVRVRGQLFLVDPVRDLTFVHLVVGFPQLYPARKRSQRLADLVLSAVVD